MQQVHRTVHRSKSNGKWPQAVALEKRATELTSHIKDIANEQVGQAVQSGKKWAGTLGTNAYTFAKAHPGRTSLISFLLGAFIGMRLFRSRD